MRRVYLVDLEVCGYAYTSQRDKLGKMRRLAPLHIAGYVFFLYALFSGFALHGAQRTNHNTYDAHFHLALSPRLPFFSLAFIANRLFPHIGRVQQMSLDRQGRSDAAHCDNGVHVYRCGDVSVGLGLTSSHG